MTANDITRMPYTIPGCGRGMGIDAWRRRFGDLTAEESDYVCQVHWSKVPTAMRRVYARARRRDRKIGVHMPSTSRLWRRIMTEIRAST